MWPSLVVGHLDLDGLVEVDSEVLGEIADPNQNVRQLDREAYRLTRDVSLPYLYRLAAPPLLERGGLVCLNSAARFDKWNRAAVR